MLDLHTLTSGGSTGGALVNTIPSNDGAVTAGVPVAAGATLVGWGALTTIADTLKSIVLNSQDLLDNQNGEAVTFGGTAAGIFHHWDNLPYAVGQRTWTVAQNTGAANDMVYSIDQYPGGPVQGPSPWYNGGPPLNPLTAIPAPPATGPNGQSYRPAIYSTVFGGALTAITYGTVSLNPTNPIPAGKYAILGCWVSSLTNYAIIRFLHTDFGPLSPGFPVVDPHVAIARAVTPLDQLLLTSPGHQFTLLSTLLGVPCEPVITITPGTTGLRYQVIDITADTPEVIVNLVRVS